MRIFKVPLWIPVSLTILCAVTFVLIDYYNAKRAMDNEGSTGLGAVAGGFFMEPRATPHAVWEESAASENYSAVSENGFTDSAAERLSTVSIDVDTASYSNIRRFLNSGKMPPPAAIRVEEMLNYFTYPYPDPSAAHPVSITTEVAACPWKVEHRLLRLGLKSKAIVTSNLPPARLTFLIDVSGSMNHPTKLPLVKRSLALLVQQLRVQDSVAIVVYAGSAGLVLAPAAGSQDALIIDALDRLEAGGSTAGGQGIQLAYATARSMYRGDANNRVILVTDGDFNVGPSSDEELVRIIESEREDGIYLTVLGFGMDNLQDGKLEKLADRGNGHYAYIDTIAEAQRVFVQQLGATLQTVAKDVKFQVEFNPSRVRSYRLVGYENRKLAAEDFHDDRKDAGELGAGHSVTALYELVPNGAGPLTEDAFTLRLRYKPPTSAQSVEMSANGSAETHTPSADFRFASAVAEFGMLLSGSKYAGEATFASALELAQPSMAGDAARAEFVALVRKAAELRK
jgi:Ca-activated chloride channel family protein